MRHAVSAPGEERDDRRRAEQAGRLPGDPPLLAELDLGELDLLPDQGRSALGQQLVAERRSRGLPLAERRPRRRRSSIRAFPARAGLGHPLAESRTAAAARN